MSWVRAMGASANSVREGRGAGGGAAFGAAERVGVGMGMGMGITGANWMVRPPRLWLTLMAPPC